MAYLYINSRGKPHTKHSYSSGNTFDQSAYKYYLQKILGWRERDNKARFLFGKAVEESIQYYSEHDGQVDISEDFRRRWAAHEGDGEISYTDTEKDWKTCEIMGRDIVRLYAAVQPTLPIPLGGRSVWQRNYSKEVFPGDLNYGGIDFEGRLDIICYADPNHSMLPKVDWRPEYGTYRPLIVDVKTSAVDFPEQQGMAALDSQLRVYSWVSGIRDVALLWLKKTGLSYKKGYTATVIDPTGSYQSGQDCIIAKVDGGDAWVVPTEFMILEMDKAQGKKGEKLDQTDDAKQRQQNWLDQFGQKISLDRLTRQRLQFNAGRVSEQSAQDAGRIAARQIVGIVNAWKNKNWPNTFGIRYPKDDRNDSYFRAFVLQDEQYRKLNFTKSDEESFDNLFHEDEL